MRKFIALFAFISGFNAFAMDLHCTAAHNMDIVLETNISIQEGERNKAFGEFDHFKFFVTADKSNQIEIQSLDLSTPSRSYATSKLTQKGSFVELSVWSREYLLEVRCTLL